MTTPSDILTADEAADYLRISPARVRGLALSGVIPAMQFGDDWRFMRGQLYDYMTRQAEAEQYRRQQQNSTIKKAKAQGMIKAKRGRPSKVDTGKVIDLYAKLYGETQ